MSRPAVAGDHRQVAGRRPRRRTPRSRSRAAPRALATSSSASTRLVRLGHPPHAREVEQVVDQLLHPLGAVDREGDVLVGALVELPLVAALEHLGEARDLAQRLLEVVRGDVGELLELLVGALELAGLLDQRPLRVAQRGELGDDPARASSPRRTRARGSRAAPTRRAAVEVLARGRADRLRQPRERPDDDTAQEQRGRGDREQDEQAGAEEHRARELRPVVERRARLEPDGGQAALLARECGADVVELLTAGGRRRRVGAGADRIDGRFRIARAPRRGRVATPASSRRAGASRASRSRPVSARSASRSAARPCV